MLSSELKFAKLKLLADQNNAKENILLKCTFPEAFTPNPGAQQRLFTEYVSLTPDKLDLATCEWLYYRGGIGSGKSFSGAAFICSGALRDKASRSLITAGSYGQLRTGTLVALAEFCKTFRVPLSPVAEVDIEDVAWADLTAKRIADNKFCTIFGAPVLVLSSESFTGRTKDSKEVGRGLQVRRVWADEFAYAPESAFITVAGRIGRGPGSLEPLALITSSINKNQPYNWCYERFDSPDRTEESQRLFVSIQGDSRENIHADPNYVKKMETMLGIPELIEIELRGGYAAITVGVIYSTFVRSLHCLYGEESEQLLSYNTRENLHISFDFNHNPACAAASQIIDDELRIIKEWYLTDSDTFELSEAVCQWIKTLGHQRRTYIYGDASGNQKTANSRKTNWQIVYDSLKKHGILFETRIPASNPNIVDSVNALKIRFKADKVFVNGATCKELVKDFESLKWKNGEIDKSDPARSHVQDGIRYLVHQIWPYNGGGNRPRSVRGKIKGAVI